MTPTTCASAPPTPSTDAAAVLATICDRAAEARRTGRGSTVAVGGVPTEATDLLKALRTPKGAAALCFESVNATPTTPPQIVLLCDIALLSFRPDFSDRSRDADAEARRVTRILVELARLAAASGVGHAAVVTSLRGVGRPEKDSFGVVADRLDDVIAFLPVAPEGPSWLLAYCCALVDLLATIAARPLGSGVDMIRRRMRLRAELAASGAQRRLARIQDLSWEIVEAPQPQIAHEVSLSQLLLTPGEVIRKRASSGGASSGGASSGDPAAARAGGPALDDRTRGVSQAVAAESIGSIVDDMDRIHLDDTENEQQRLDAAAVGPRGDSDRASDARDAAATYVAKLDRSVAACEDASALRRVVRLFETLFQTLEGEDVDGAAEDADAPPLSLAQVLELSMGVRRTILEPDDEPESPAAAEAPSASEEEEDDDDSTSKDLAATATASATPRDEDADVRVRAPDEDADVRVRAPDPEPRSDPPLSPEAAAQAAIAVLTTMLKTRARRAAPVEAPPVPAPVPVPAPAAEAAADPRYDAYRRMLRVGVPLAAVEVKMRAEGVEPSGLEERTRDAPPEDPRCDAYRTMLRMGVPRAAVEVKMRAEGVDPGSLSRAAAATTPSPGRERTRSRVVRGPAPSVATKRLFWEPLDDRALDASWWTTCDDASFEEARAVVEASMAELETSFQHVAAEPARRRASTATTAAAASPASNEITALSEKRSQGVALVLKTVRDRGLGDAKVVADALRGASATVALDEDALELLRRVALPSKAADDAAEADACAAALRDAEADARPLREQDAYVAEFAVRVPRLRARFDALLVRAAAPKALAEVAESLGKLSTALDAVFESEHLRHVLRVALVVGNALNDGSSRTGAGVGLSALAKLSELKDAQGQSLVRFLLRAVQCRAGTTGIARSAPGLVVDLAEPLGAATRDDVSGVDDALARLRAYVTLVRSEAAFGPPDAGALDAYADWLGDQVATLDDARRETAAAGRDLLREFGEDPTTPLDALLRTLAAFLETWQRELAVVRRETLARQRAAVRAERDAVRAERLAVERAHHEEARRRARRRIDAGVRPPTASALLGDSTTDDIDSVVTAMRARNGTRVYAESDSDHDSLDWDS